MRNVIGNLLIGVAIGVGLEIAAPGIGFSGKWWVAVLVANVGTGIGRGIADD